MATTESKGEEAGQQQLSLGMLLVLVLRLAVILGIIRQLVAFVF